MVKRRNRGVTQCRNGHDYTDENTYTYRTKDGHIERHCRTCRRERMRDRRDWQGTAYRTPYTDGSR